MMKAASIIGFLICGSVSSEKYTLDFDKYNNNAPFIKNERGHRMMQIETGNRPDINATDDACRLVGSRFQCTLNDRIVAQDGTFTDFDVTMLCEDLDPFVAFDFRRKPCSCKVDVVSSDGSKKACKCQTCPDGYGPSPISLDCNDVEEDPYIISTCTSMDCNFGCNGTCNFDCSNPTPECLGLCEEAGGPTAAPTGTPLDPDDSGASAMIGLASFVVAVAAAAFF